MTTQTPDDDLLDSDSDEAMFNMRGAPPKKEPAAKLMPAPATSHEGPKSVRPPNLADQADPKNAGAETMLAPPGVPPPSTPSSPAPLPGGSPPTAKAPEIPASKRVEWKRPPVRRAEPPKPEASPKPTAAKEEAAAKAESKPEVDIPVGEKTKGFIERGEYADEVIPAYEANAHYRKAVNETISLQMATVNPERPVSDAARKLYYDRHPPKPGTTPRALAIEATKREASVPPDAQPKVDVSKALAPAPVPVSPTQPDPEPEETAAQAEAPAGFKKQWPTGIVIMIGILCMIGGVAFVFVFGSNGSPTKTAAPATTTEPVTLTGTTVATQVDAPATPTSTKACKSGWRPLLVSDLRGGQTDLTKVDSSKPIHYPNSGVLHLECPVGIDTQASSFDGSDCCISQ